jgi:AAA domain, putative AbiEii toxin, Type IV TA system
MKEHLAIRNFGPISEADIEPRALTVFVGPQATGKSLAAQALYFLRGLEDLLVPDDDTPREAMLSALQWWFGNDPSVYAGPGTLLRWNPAKSPRSAKQETRWIRNGVNLSESLKKRIVAWQKKKQEYFPKTQVYIPAGRTLYSFLPPSSALRIASRARPQQQWPGYIVTFYETLENALKELSREETQINLFSDIKSLQRLEPDILSVLKGHLRYSPDTVMLEVGKVSLRPVNIAAGQMEIWPFWTIMKAGLQSGTLTASEVYFEEPEAHLHPGAQHDVMRIIAYLVEQGVRFLVTTHSPYILYAVNNFLMAQKVLDAGRTLPAGIPPETALRPDQVAAYRFAADGTVHDIMDAEVGLIDEDELDQVADDLGATFTQLQEQLDGMSASSQAARQVARAVEGRSMSVPEWLIELGIPNSCIVQESAAKEHKRRFSILPRQGDVIWRVQVDGCWLQSGGEKRVDYLFWGQSASGRKAILLVELKGGDFGKALDQIGSTLKRLCKRGDDKGLHLGPHQHSPGHDPTADGGVLAYVVLSNGRQVPQHLTKRQRLQHRYGVLVRTGERYLEVNGVDAIFSR